MSTKGGALVHATLHPWRGGANDQGPVRAGWLREEEGARGLKRYVVTLDDGDETSCPRPSSGAAAQARPAGHAASEGRAADAKNFLLRRTALQLDDERRNDALGALLASRVMVKPHQVGVVQRVLSCRRPRFVLADEVGLGKTIEAGMVFSALRLAGLARRVLVVAPSHLTVQWLVELFHKFNQLFTLMDTERYEQSLDEQPTVSPWARFDFVVTSLELLQRTEQHREEAGDPTAHWDLVIIDEAHHLKGEKAYEAAQALAKNTWGLLLLTATPMQLDPAEYQALLSLIDPLTAPTVEGVRGAAGPAGGAVQGAARAVGGQVDGAARSRSWRSSFPDDDALQEIEDPDEMLVHLAETYSLSDRLIRNRRAVVGGFSERKLHVHQVGAGRKSWRRVTRRWRSWRKDGTVRGAALASLVRRLESSPAAFLAALRGNKALAGMKLVAAREGRQVRRLREGAAADLVEGAAAPRCWSSPRPATPWSSLQSRLRVEQVEALGVPRRACRWRSATGRWPASATPTGRRCCCATEVGGEGRNFQFAHHLVNYDLPWSPATMEQRIGRLDRIGQTQPVDIHVFEAPGTFSADVLARAARRGGRVRRDGGRPRRGARRGRAPADRAGAGADPKVRAAYVKDAHRQGEAARASR